MHLRLVLTKNSINLTTTGVTKARNRSNQPKITLNKPEPAST